MERVIEMALSELVETDKELKTFDGPTYRALALQVAHYLGLDKDLVTKGKNSSAICIGRLVAMFKPIEDTNHIQVELIGPLYDLEGICFTYKQPSDIYPLVNMIVKASGARDTTEMQLLRRIQVTMRKSKVDVSFSYGEIAENTYGVIIDLEYPEVENAKARFYLQATQHDLETIAICKAEADMCDGLETKNECSSIVAQEACLYMLEMFAQVCGVNIKTGKATIVH